MRRLPIYFLVDISGASDINKLNMCLLKFLLYIRENPYMVETACISIITIGDTAKIVLPLTEFCDIKAIPIFHEEKGMALGKALNILMDDIDKNVVNVVNLPAAGQFLVDSGGGQVVVPRGDDGFDRGAPARRGIYERNVAQRGERLVERARNRRGAEHQGVYAHCFGADFFLLFYAKAVFLVNNHQP